LEEYRDAYFNIFSRGLTGRSIALTSGLIFNPLSFRASPCTEEASAQPDVQISRNGKTTNFEKETSRLEDAFARWPDQHYWYATSTTVSTSVKEQWPRSSVALRSEVTLCIDVSGATEKVDSTPVLAIWLVLVGSSFASRYR
jgi:hypothetical protein